MQLTSFCGLFLFSQYDFYNKTYYNLLAIQLISLKFNINLSYILKYLHENAYISAIKLKKYFMKGKLLPLSGLLLTSLFINTMKAQEYQPIGIQSGFNADVIANGVGAASTSTSTDVDGVSYAFISRDFQLTSSSTALTYGLPISGNFTSAVASTPGLTYQLASYSSNNSLRLEASGDSGTLIFATPLKAISLYMLATGGSGACTVDVTVNFTDNTTQTLSGNSISDWYGGTNYAIQGIGRINLNNNVLESGSGTNPRLYQIPLAIDAANQNKEIQSVTVTKSGTGGIPNIFAFSADAFNPCLAPTNISATTTPTSATVNWTASASNPSSGYQYYYSTSPTPPTTTTNPSGSVAAGTTSVTLDNLTTGQTYYFWIRSNCGGSSYGFWKSQSFTTGEVPVTFTLGDINTEYVGDNNPTNTSTSSCPGTLTVNVPTGYKIKSTKVSYTMTAQSGAWMSEQRSLLVCTTNGTAETDVAAGVSSNAGTYSYNRSDLTLANGLTGAVNFELRAWRKWGGENLGCDASYNKVNDGSWKVTVILEPLNLSTNEAKAEKKIVAYPNPFTDVLRIEKSENVKRATLTDLSGVTVKVIDNPSSTLQLDGIKTGVYILSLNLKDGSVQTQKVIKK